MAEKEDGKHRILVVDDDADVVETIKMAISDLGQPISTANNGLRALELCGQEDPDIIILDLMLPNRGGFQVLQKIKGNRQMKGKRPLVCMVTGNEGMMHKKFAEQLGVDEYLRKPFPMTHLVDIVQEFIEKLDAGIEDAK